ncbi:hypothetical protein GW12_20060 [Acinetobacter sp. HR7]|nr:hypothetical protein GW12_20060 [Acinetobacter sp. HR7]
MIQKSLQMQAFLLLTDFNVYNMVKTMVGLLQSGLIYFYSKSDCVQTTSN